MHDDLSPVNAIGLASWPMQSPEDTSALRHWLAEPGPVREPVALFIKTEGNGLDNDWSRPLAARTASEALAEAGWAVRDAARAGGVMLVVSGGCEGVATPHMMLLFRHAAAPAGGGARRLALGQASAPPLASAEIGCPAQVVRTRDAVLAAMRQAGLSAAEVEYVHVVAPWVDSRGLPPEALAGLVAAGAHASKPHTRRAAALGAALALGDIEAAPASLAEMAALPPGRRCAVTAGDTGGRTDVLVFGNRAGAGGRLTVRLALLRDLLDTAAIRPCLPVAPTRLAGAIYKGDPPPADTLRGERHIMHHDSDIQAFRHYRAAVSGVLAATLGTTRVFTGGGAEHQCPPGGALLTLIHEEPDDE